MMCEAADDESIECVNDCTVDKDPKPMLPVTRSEILDAITMVRTVNDSKRIVNHLMECHQIVAIDVKGRDLGKRNGKISLIAVGTCNGQCLLFDIHSNSQLVIKGRLKFMLQCREIIKVMHDCCLIRSALQQCYGVKIRSIFDTQIAHSVIEAHRSGKNPRCIPYETPLFISYTYGRCVLTPADHALEKLYLENSNFWDIRPLPCKQKEYAARGVLALVPEAYNNMNRRLQGPLRQTFRALCLGKSIELAERESAQGQGTSTTNDCRPSSNKRTLSADRSCIRSCSSSSSSVFSARNSSSCFRCGPSPISPPRKKVQKIAKFSITPRKSVSVSSCGSKKKRFVVRKTTKTTCNCVTCSGPKKRACANAKASENCNCVKHISTTTLTCSPSKKRRAAKSISLVNCKRRKPAPVCKKKRSSCISLSSSSTPKPKSRIRVCPKKKKVCPKKFSCVKTLAGKKRCPRPLKTKKCVPVKRKLPCKKSSICLCKTLGKKVPPVKSASLVRRGWKTVMSMDVDDDYSDDSATMDTDDENDFEDEMPPPAAKRKR